VTGVSLEEAGLRHECEPGAQLVWTHLQNTGRLTEGGRPFVALARLNEELGEPFFVIGSLPSRGAPVPDEPMNSLRPLGSVRSRPLALRVPVWPLDEATEPTRGHPCTGSSPQTLVDDPDVLRVVIGTPYCGGPVASGTAKTNRVFAEPVTRPPPTATARYCFLSTA